MTKLLVIDDDQRFCSAIRDLLSEYGYTVNVAPGGREGLDLAFYDGPFAAALIDLAMPEIDGLQVISRLAAEQPEIPLIAVSGTKDLNTAVQAMRSGAWDYVQKPIHDVSLLLTALDRVFMRAQRIVSRESAERELHASEERYRRIFESVAASIILVDQDGVVVDINPYHLENFAGGTTQREDYVGRSVHDFPRVMGAGLSAVFDLVLSGETFEKKDIHFAPTPRSPGSYFHVRGVPLQNEGQVTGAVFVHEDITQRTKAQQELQAKLDDQAALFEASRTLLGQYDVKTAMATLCQLAVEQFGLTMAWVGTVVEDTKQVLPASSYGALDNYLHDIDVRWDDTPAGQGPTGTAIRTAEAVSMNHIATDPTYEHWRSAALERGYQSSAALPLLDGEDVLGALNVYSCEPEFFTDDRIQLLQSFANLGAVALRSAHLHERDKQRLDYLEDHVSERTAQLTEANLELERMIAERLEAEVALIDSEERYRRLVEHSPYGIMVHCDGNVVYANSTAVQLLGATSAKQLLGMPITRFIHPDFLEIAQERIAFVIEHQGSARSRIVRFIRLDGAKIDVEVSATYSSYDGEPAVQTFILDVSDRDSRARRYTQRLHILREIYRAILAAESPVAIAQAVLSRVQQLVEYEWSSLTLFDFQNGLTIRRIAVVTDTARARSQREKQMPLSHFRGLDTLKAGRYFYVDDVSSVEMPSPGEVKMLERGIRSYANVPLHVADQLIGSLNVESTHPSGFPPSKIEILREVAGPLAIAIQQANLHEQIRRHANEMEQRVADRTKELSVLYQVSAVAIESLEIEVTLSKALKTVLENIDARSGAIQVLDKATQQLMLVAHQGISKALIQELEAAPIDQGLASIVIRTGKPQVLGDIKAYLVNSNSMEETGFKSYIGIPIRAGGEPSAVLSIFRRQTSDLTVEEIAMLSAVTDHIGMAVDNAILRRGTERAAALEERERLAQDLHDSVTQSLYSLTLFARAARVLAHQERWKQLGDRLTDIEEGSTQALREMRLLVHQLRPAALQQEGLARALQKRLDAVERRSGIEAALHVTGDVEIPGEIEMSLYMLALEALNNALKHSAATQVDVYLDMTSDAVDLAIHDNGKGFDPTKALSQGGMGLANMQARVVKLDGRLSIRSAPGSGSQIQIRVTPASSGK